MILHMNPENPQPRRIEQVIEVLKEGKLIAYPTDTVYGIGCDLHNKSAVEKLNRLVTEVKLREEGEKHSPLSFICKDLSNIAEYAVIGNEAYRTMRRYLPGAYTFILEASRKVPKVLLQKRKTVGIRVPDAAIPIAIVTALGNPITTTSATLADGQLIPDPWTINDLYGHLVDLIIDGGYLYPEPSTVIDFTGVEGIVLREGKGQVPTGE